jgi:hypothetical protein
MGHNALTRAIRHAEARDLVRRNVAMLVDTPKGPFVVLLGKDGADEADTAFA